MSFFVRSINGILGSAIAVRGGDGEERKLAVFADAAIRDFALVGEDRCVLISRKQGVALVDLASCEVIKRGRLPLGADRIAVARDGARALAYHCNPGLLTVVDLTSLDSVAQFNLIQLRGDGSFDLLHRDHERLKQARTPWDSIPFSDGPLRAEVKSDELWLKYAPAEPSGLRRMHFTQSTRAVFRADGKVIVPFELRINGREWVTGRGYEKPITASAFRISVGVAVIDLDAARVEMMVARQRTEPGVYTAFPVRSISPEGTCAILQSFDPVAQCSDTEGTASGGMLRNVFGRRPASKLAFGLEQWDIAGDPCLRTAFAFRPLNADTMLRTDTQRFSDAELTEARKEIDLVFPGVEAGFSSRQEEWRTSHAKRQGDAYFDPLEMRKAPAFNPAFNRAHYPKLFAEMAQRMVKLDPKPFSSIPWDRLDDRQCRFLSGLLSGWGKHSTHAVESIAWISSDRMVILSRDGKVREVSTSGDIGHAYQLTDPTTKTWPFAERNVSPAELHYVEDRTLAVDLFNVRLEFDLPPFADPNSGDLDRTTPLSYRVTLDGDGHTAEVKHVDRLAEKIRRGYIKVGSKDARSIIACLHELANEVRDHWEEIVVDHRWLPSVHYRGKPVVEAEFAEILIADGSDEAVRALDVLLTAFLDATEGKHQNIWHPDDGTPTMGPVSIALIKLCNPLPPSVFRFYTQRDMDHDMWTYEAFERLDLPKERFLSADLVTLQARLAIQDICTGNVDADILALYRLKLVREALRADPSIGPDLADVIISQLEAQAPDLTWASGAGVPGVAEAIAESLDNAVPAEVALAAELRRRAVREQAA